MTGVYEIKTIYNFSFDEDELKNIIAFDSNHFSDKDFMVEEIINELQYQNFTIFVNGVKNYLEDIEIYYGGEFYEKIYYLIYKTIYDML